jgi:hypothetical protein
MSDTQTAGDADKTPVNYVYFDGRRRVVIRNCVLCGGRHGHGSRDPVLAQGGRSHRRSHCGGETDPSGYYIELAPDADVPPNWETWVMNMEAGQQ